MKLASNDPLAPALIDPNYLSEPADLDLLTEGVALAREIGAAAAFGDWRAQETYPGPNGAKIADRRNFVLRAVNSFPHPIGTCRIGAVIDEALHVRGVAGLRVIDASVLPGIPLLVEAGRDRHGHIIGVPYGGLARLILLYLQTEAIRTNSPEVELGRSMNVWLGRMSLSAGAACEPSPEGVSYFPPYKADVRASVIHGDCLAVLPTLEERTEQPRVDLRAAIEIRGD